MSKLIGFVGCILDDNFLKDLSGKMKLSEILHMTPKRSRLKNGNDSSVVIENVPINFYSHFMSLTRGRQS